MTLQEKIESRTARIGIIGLGYVGLPLAVEFGKAGFNVHGFDLDENKIAAINAGKSYIPDVPTPDVKTLTDDMKLTASTTFDLLDQMDAAIICVPTPLKKTKDPDIQYIVAACESIAAHLHSGMLISLESSTYPGTTDELMLPMFTQRGFEVGKDFYLCFSPERVDPGNKNYHTKNIPKVIGGITPDCTKHGQLLYETAIETIIPVEGTRTAEMVKLLENTFRMVNIGLVNELAIMCDKMNINIWDVIDAAKTKPFGFMPFYPGPGLGGHCIPIDPFYFSWKAKQYGCEPRFIETAGYVNSQMPHYVVQKVQDALNKEKKAINGAKILLLGMAYKKDIDDVRESPALDVAHLLLDKGAELKYFDMYIPIARVNGYVLESITMNQIDTAISVADCVVITTNHSYMDYTSVAEDCKLVVDTRNALKGLTSPKIVRI
jgi:UDP-N-acetyl-D-glucosamine dehydrogenase